MTSEKAQSSKSKRHFAGCIELIPPAPAYIEFIDAHRIWGFPIHHLRRFVLLELMAATQPKTAPPDRLVLAYPETLVVLAGWRLELLVGPLLCGRVARVHAEKHLGPLMIDEAWVSEIHVSSPHDKLLNDLIHR